MTNPITPPPRVEEFDTQELELTRDRFLLARAQLAAARTEPLQRDAARWAWSQHERRST
jgi:hypothetical protein